jgi:hypothetical protein
VLDWLEQTRVADAIRESLALTAGLSAVHLLGFTLVTGGALVSNLRMLGALLARYPVEVVTRPAARGIAAGLAISITTGGLLFTTRANAAWENNTFRVKMLLLVTASLFHLFVHRPASRSASPGVRALTGAVGLSLWMGLALAGCAFILLE